jgi:hypothetical protein
MRTTATTTMSFCVGESVGDWKVGRGGLACRQASAPPTGRGAAAMSPGNGGVRTSLGRQGTQHGRRHLHAKGVKDGSVEAAAVGSMR